MEDYYTPHEPFEKYITHFVEKGSDIDNDKEYVELSRTKDIFNYYRDILIYNMKVSIFNELSKIDILDSNKIDEILDNVKIEEQDDDITVVSTSFLKSLLPDIEYDGAFKFVMWIKDNIKIKKITPVRSLDDNDNPYISDILITEKSTNQQLTLRKLLNIWANNELYKKEE